VPIIRYVVSFVRRTQTFWHIFEPLPTWGPINEEDYNKNMKNERAAWTGSAM
jgi:hypothetical protein